MNVGKSSRFLEEIPSELKDEIRSTYNKREFKPSNEFSVRENPTSEAPIKLGQRVVHKKFGEGTVMAYEGENTKSQNHIHKNSFWSGVYYFDDTYGDKAGSLSLRNPIHQLSSFSPNCKELTSVTATEIYIKPKSNTLVMFPSYVYHEVALHEEDNDRHSLAFNVMPIGQYGTGDSRYDTSWGTLK